MSDYKITETLQNYYDKVFQDGKLVNVNFGMWGMSYNLEAEDIKLENELPDEIQLGKKFLIKKAVYNKFKAFENKVRRYLYTNSFNFPLVSQAHFVPKTKYFKVYEQLSELREQYAEMCEEFFEKYESYKQEAIDFYTEHKNSVNIENIEKFYPLLADLRKKFYLDIVSFEISLPTSFAQIDLHDEIQREEKANEAASKYAAEYQKQITTQMAKIGDFVNDVTATLRSNVVEHCSVALDKLKNKEVMSTKNIQKLLGHIQEFKDMNFVEDKVIASKLSEMEQFLNGDRDFAKDKDALGLLQQHLTNIVTEAKSMSDLSSVSGEYFRKLNI
jgi:hypothetical protein